MTDCNNSKHGQFNSIDRLSDLPDFIIHQIISYLYTEEAYRTSVLSKRWNQVFTTNPILDFYHYNFPTDMIPRYLEYIDARMQKISRENLRIKTFKLALRRTDLLLGCKVDEWLEIAVRNQVAEIELQDPVNYKLPRFLFCAKSLRDLDIANVKIPYYEALDLVSLESLVLGNVVVEERMLFHIVSSCLLLKKLLLSFCPGFKNLTIPCHSKLEDLYIEGNVPEDGRVILETSSLRSFDYNTNGVNPWPIISNHGLLRNLRHLLVTGLSITGEDLAKLLQEELTSLEKLEFIGCRMLTSIKISHTQLKQICFYECNNLLNIVIDVPNLKKFKFHGKIPRPLSITIHSQANYCNIHVRTKARYLDTGGFFKLKKLLKGLNSCNVLKIMLDDEPFESNEEEEEEEEEEDGNLGPPCDIGELKLNLYSYSELSISSSLSAFLNGLFRTCHPPIISLRVHSSCHKLTLETLLNNLVNMVNCLRNPLKRIEVGETNNHSRYLEVQLRLCW
ncbi:putative F-box/LRR-repeat protein At3g58920 [Silene latifolia]|uniref:putative F-box/LRR-repeat protein At3g58920 n=1 Tax=Silene latifolia TaxID=37657 RepID=UPI003D787F4D